MVAIGDGILGHDTLNDIGQWGLVMANQIMTTNNVPLSQSSMVLSVGSRSVSFNGIMRSTMTSQQITADFFVVCKGPESPAAFARSCTIRARVTVGMPRRGRRATRRFILPGSKIIHRIERMYVFQIREANTNGQYNGDGSRFNVNLRDQQRLFADQFTNLSVMSTYGLDGHDGIHFYFTNGYENIGLNIARMMQRDLYGGPSLPNTDSPNPAYAVLTGRKS